MKDIKETTGQDMKGQCMTNDRELNKVTQKITKQYDTNLESYDYASDKF